MPQFVTINTCQEKRKQTETRQIGTGKRTAWTVHKVTWSALLAGPFDLSTFPFPFLAFLMRLLSWSICNEMNKIFIILQLEMRHSLLHCWLVTACWPEIMLNISENCMHLWINFICYIYENNQILRSMYYIYAVQASACDDLKCKLSNIKKTSDGAN